MKLSQTIKSFTLLEIIITIIIVSVIASLALVSYDRIYERQLWHRARNDLIAMHAAAQIYKIQHGSFPDPDDFGPDNWWFIDDINTHFNINIVQPDGYIYAYTNLMQGNLFSAVREVNGNGNGNYRIHAKVDDPISNDSADPNPYCITDGLDTSGPKPFCPLLVPEL